MSRIARHATLVLCSLIVCAALIAVGPMSALAPLPEGTGSSLHSDSLSAAFEPATSMPAAQRAIHPAGLSPARLAEGQPSAAEMQALELLPPAPTAQPVARAAAPARPARIPGNGPAMRGELVLQTERLDIYVGSRTFSQEDISAFGWKLEALLRENEDGFYPTKIDRRISIGFYNIANAPSRGTRGIAYTGEGRIEIYYRPTEDLSAAFTIATHELAHHLQYQRYGEEVHRRADLLLLEGEATWVSGVRWLKEYGVPSWRGRAHQLHGQGIPLVLASAERYGSDNAYELWASFISYLYKTYGMETIDQLYRSSRGRAIGSADYKGVTGRSFKELTADWREWVLAYEPPPEPTPEPTPPPPIPVPRQSIAER
jgi:hypothetical protein